MSFYMVGKFAPDSEEEKWVQGIYRPGEHLGAIRNN
jgi:hypothetical protein